MNEDILITKYIIKSWLALALVSHLHDDSLIIVDHLCSRISALSGLPLFGFLGTWLRPCVVSLSLSLSLSSVSVNAYSKIVFKVFHPKAQDALLGQ